jgi:hypothetical protein
MHNPNTALLPARTRWRWWRIALFLGGALLLLTVLLLGVRLFFERSIDQQLQDALAEADRLDPGWELDQLEARRRTVPDEENSALRIRILGGTLPDHWDDQPCYQELSDSPPPVQLGERQMEGLRADLGQRTHPLEQARNLADLSHGRYPITWAPDFLSTLTPHLAEARKVTNLLVYDAALRAQDGDADGALDSGRAALSAARSIGDEPLLLSQVQRVGRRAVAVQSMQRTLAQGQPSDKALAAAQKLLEEEAEEPLLLIALRGERAGDHMLLTNVESGNYAGTAAATALASRSLQGAVDRFLLHSAVKPSHTWLMKLLTDAIEIAKLPPEQQDERLAQLPVLDEKALPFAGLLMPDIPKAAGSFRRSMAELRSAQTALAVERYRQAHERWPERLVELLPAYLERVPGDPYDGEELRYRRLDDGVVIYALGPDGKDDGGNLAGRKVPVDGTDVGFRLWNVAQRRQPAAQEP